METIYSEQQFNDVLYLPKAIIYLLVDWSGQERVSRSVILRVLNEIKGVQDVPIFKINCTDQQQKFVQAWLVSQSENMKQFYYGGYGETLLIKKGTVADFIADPGKIGVADAKEKIEKWLRQE